MSTSTSGPGESVFFYGLFMDAGVLEGKGIRAVEPRVGRLEGYRLSIGARATLVSAQGEAVYGVVMQVPAEEIERLYSESSVSAYRSEAIQVTLSDGQRVEAVCYNLPPPVEPSEPNRAYARELHDVAKRLGLPDEYLTRIAQAGEERGA